MTRKAILFVSGSLAAIFAATSANAQQQNAVDAPNSASAAVQSTTDGSTAPAVDVGDIIVTANKRAERLQDVPKTVDVIQGDTVQKLNIRQFSEIEQLAPGLSLTPKDSTSNNITLRGVGFDPNSGAASTVDVYFNEVPIALSSAFRGLYDIGQIEVLRGPQGTLRGRTSPAGAITIGSARPDLDKIDGYAQQTLSTQDGINTQGAVSVPLIDGVLAVRAAGLFDRNIGQAVHNDRNGSDDRDRTESGRISVALKPAHNIDILATYQHLSNRQTTNTLLATLPGATTSPILQLSDRQALVSRPTQTSYTGDQVTLGAQWDLGPVFANYVGGYQKTDLKRDADLANGGSIPNFSSGQTLDSSARTVTQELRLASKNNKVWNWLIGGFFSDTNSLSIVSQQQYLYGIAPPAPPPAGALLTIGINIPSKVRDYAVFTDHRFQVTSRDLFEVGVRYQKEDFDRLFTLTLNSPLLGPAPIVQEGISPGNRTGSYQQVTGSASFKHDFSNTLTGYVNYGRSYRPGGVIATTAPLDESLLLFKPETSNSYEIGLKGSALDRRVSFAFSGFWQDFKNFQAYTGSYLAVSSARSGVPDNNVAFTFNGDARTRGFEATVGARVGDHLQLGLSGNYADAKFKNALAPCNDYNGDGIPDSVGVPSVPKGQQVAFCRLNGRLSDQAPYNITVNAEYAVPVSSSREFFVRGLANYVPHRTDPFINISYDAVLNNSVFVGFRGTKGEYEFSVFGKNLGNTTKALTANGQQIDYNSVATGYGSYTVTRPREFGLIGRVAF